MFDWLFEGRPLFYYLRRLAPCEADAWELLQETWLKAFRSLGSLRDPRTYAMSSYSYGIIPTGPNSNDHLLNTAARQTLAPCGAFARAPGGAGTRSGGRRDRCERPAADAPVNTRGIGLPAAECGTFVLPKSLPTACEDGVIFRSARSSTRSTDRPAG